jgi:glutamate carboxypeptidase
MSGLTTVEQRIVDTVEPGPMLSRVEAWAAINSGSHNLAGLAEMAWRIADCFAVLPGEIDLIEGDAVESITADGRVISWDMGRHLVLRVRPDAPRRIVLTGHMDTVFAADHPFQRLTWLDSNTLNGPGVADMKGGLSLMLAALEAFEAGPVAQNLGYDVLINSDEEIGSLSSVRLIAQVAQGKVAALTYEPALPDGTLAGARAGSGNFAIHIAGRSAHAGRNPQDGRNAILAASDLALRLAEGAKAIGLPCNPAKIDGGGPNNMVPDLAILRVNFRPASPDIEYAARHLLDRSMADVAAAHEVSVHAHGGFNRPPKRIDAGAQRLFGLVKRAGGDLGLAIDWRDTGGVCDGNNIAACGIPVVDTMGARGGAIHSSDEFLLVDSLVERARLSALTITRIAEGALQP